MADCYCPRGPDEITEKFHGWAAAARHQERYAQGLVDDWAPMTLDIVHNGDDVCSTLVLRRIVRTDQTQ